MNDSPNRNIEHRRTVHGGAASALSVQFQAWRETEEMGAIDGCEPADAKAFGVYIRNPLAMHVQDFIPGRDSIGTLSDALAAGWLFADRLADHLGCKVESTLPRERFAYQPVRDLYRDAPIVAGADPSATRFEPCSPDKAEAWAVTDLFTGELVNDYPNEAQARHAVQCCARGLPVPDAAWSVDAGERAQPAPVIAIPPRGPAEEPLDFAPMIAGMRGLLVAVSDLYRVYDERDIWNTIQPPEMEHALAMSLDDWALQIGAAIGAWEARAALFDKLQGLGFAPEMGGGGCIHLSAYIEGAGHVWVTAGDGSGLPTADSWMVCPYPPGDDAPAPLWSLSHGSELESGQEGPDDAAGLLTAAEAALATARLATAPAAPGDCLRSWDVTLTATGVDVTASGEAQALRYALGDLNDASLGPWNVTATLVCPAGDPQAVGLDTGWEVEVAYRADGIWTAKGVRDVCVQAVDERAARWVAADAIGAKLVVGEG